MSINIDELTSKILRSFTSLDYDKVGHLPERIYDAVAEIVNQTNWNFLYADYHIQLIPSYSDGKVSYNGGTTVSGIGTAWQSNWQNIYAPAFPKIRINSLTGTSYVRVTTFNSDTSLVISQSLFNTASNADYTLYQDEYEIPGNVKYNGLLGIYDPVRNFRLLHIDHPTILQAGQDLQRFGVPYYYSLKYVNKNITVQFYPIPYFINLLEVHYLKGIEDLFSGNLIYIPLDFEETIIHKVKHDIYLAMNDSRAVIELQKYKNALSKMVTQYASPPDNWLRVKDYPLATQRTGNINVRII